MYLDRRLWAFTRGVRARIAGTVLLGLLAVGAGIARLALFGWLLGGERFSLWSLMGGALVLIGVWLIFREAKPEEQEECESALPQG